MARPLTFRKAIAEKYVELVRAGNYLSTSASIVGKPYSTVRGWIKEGEKHRAEGRRTSLSRFAQAVARAARESEAELVEKVRKAATGLTRQRIRKTTKPVLEDGEPKLILDHNKDPIRGPDGKVQYLEFTETVVDVTPDEIDWRAGAFLLQARWASQYGRHRVDVSGSMKHEHDHRHTVMSEEDRAIAQRICASRLRGMSRESEN